MTGSKPLLGSLFLWVKIGVGSSYNFSGETEVFSVWFTLLFTTVYETPVDYGRLNGLAEVLTSLVDLRTQSRISLP